MFSFKPTAFDYKYTPRFGRRFHIQYTEANSRLKRMKPSKLRMVAHIIKHTLKWWFK